MNASGCVACEARLSCDDSPLSITGNIIGILTFAGAIAISIQVYFNAMRNADQHMEEMMYTFESRVREVDLLRRKLEEKSEHIGGDQGERLGREMNRTRELFIQAFGLLTQLRDDNRYNSRRHWLLARAKFVVKENLIKEGLEKIDKAMEMLKGIANDVLLGVTPEPAGHEVAFRAEILQELFEMRNEMKNFKDTHNETLNEVRELLRDSTKQSPPTVA